jgi:DNA primase
MQREVDIIKEKVDVADLIRSYIQLSPAGRSLKGLCPFHGEKTPSFIVSPDKKIWHCFGCGEGGDVLSFVMKYEHVEFPEALRMLAERAGIPMRNISPTQEREFGVLYDLHEAAAVFFEEKLTAHAHAREYLLSRGISEETIREFRLGYDPVGDSLALHLMGKNFDIREITRAGLVQKVRGLNRDRFEGRIIFPLMNSFGKVVAFAGRAFDDVPGIKKEDMAKYLNSSETPIFNKSKTLYGFYKSKGFISESRTAFLVEGYMDFLMAWQTGVQNAVAVSGTAITREHLERLRRFADSLIVSFDNDAAGFRALERSMDMFHEFDFHVKAVSLGIYKDPGEAGEKDAEFLKRAVETAKPAFEYLFKRYFESDDILDIAQKKRVISHFVRRLAVLKSPVEQGIWAKALAKRADIDESVILEELQALRTGKAPQKAGEPSKTPPSRSEVLAERLLTLGFAEPDFWATISRQKELFPEKFRSLIDSPDDERNELIRMRGAYEFQGKSKAELKAEFEEMLAYLELESLQREQEVIRRRMRGAEDDDAEHARLMRAFQETAKRINDLKRPKNTLRK